MTNTIAERFEYLRIELRADRISWGELYELQCLAAYIDPSDIELLEAAGVPEGCAKLPTTPDELEAAAAEWGGDDWVFADEGNEYVEAMRTNNDRRAEFVVDAFLGFCRANYYGPEEMSTMLSDFIAYTLHLADRVDLRDSREQPMSTEELLRGALASYQGDLQETP